MAYHAYQSFKSEEVTPERCHRLGVELAKRMWDEEYQVLETTHFNTGTYHNHFVVNSIGLWDGRKFNCGKRASYQFHQLSDDLCREYHLSTIQNPKGKTPRSIYFAERNGEPTRYNLMREAVDAALCRISVSYTHLDVYKRQALTSVPSAIQTGSLVSGSLRITVTLARGKPFL